MAVTPEADLSSDTFPLVDFEVPYSPRTRSQRISRAPSGPMPRSPAESPDYITSFPRLPELEFPRKPEGPCVYAVIPSRKQELSWAQETADSLRRGGVDDCRISTEIGLSKAKNQGFQTLPKGSPDDIVLFVDNDTHLEGDLSWFRTRPTSEAFWLPRYAIQTPDLYSNLGMLFINGINLLRLWPASIGPCIVVRRWVFEQHKFDSKALLEDLWFGITLRKAGIPCHLAPLRAHVRRAFSPPQHWARTNRAVHQSVTPQI